MEEIDQKQKDEVNILSVDNVKENNKKIDIYSASSKKSESQYSTNNKGHSDKIINKDESNSIIKPINKEQERKRDATSDSTNENKKQKKSINESYGSTDKTKGNISYKVLFNKGTDSIDNILLQIHLHGYIFKKS